MAPATETKPPALTTRGCHAFLAGFVDAGRSDRHGSERSPNADALSPRGSCPPLSATVALFLLT